MGTKQKKVTSIETLKKYMEGEVIELPPFSDNQPFFARLKRPSMLTLVKEGKIPNKLLTKTNELFFDSKNMKHDVDNENLMSEMFDVLNIIAEATLAEPTLQELKENGIVLTDSQLMYIFNYSQQGIDSYGRFRNEQENRNDNSNVEGVQQTAE